MRTTLLALLVGCISVASGCTALTKTFAWKAPAKYDAIQADLDRIAAFTDEQFDDAIQNVKRTLEDGQSEPLSRARADLQTALPIPPDTFGVLWEAALERAPVRDPSQPTAEEREGLVDALRFVFGRGVEDNILYARAIGGGSNAKDSRNQLLARYIVRIQDYHESNFEDVFVGSAGWGVFLDFGALVSSALATAFTPASTKTALSALASVFSGTRLAASKNVLNERSAAAVMNAMILERTKGLNRLREGMARPIDEYSMSVGLIDLASYLNAGGLYKALAAMESETAKRQAEEAAKSASDAAKHTQTVDQLWTEAVQLINALADGQLVDAHQAAIDSQVLTAIEDFAAAEAAQKRSALKTRTVPSGQADETLVRRMTRFVALLRGLTPSEE